MVRSMNDLEIDTITQLILNKLLIYPPPHVELAVTVSF